MLLSDVCFPCFEPSLNHSGGYRLHDQVRDVGPGVTLDHVLKHNSSLFVLVKLEHSNNGVTSIGNGLSIGVMWLLFGSFAIGG